MLTIVQRGGATREKPPEVVRGQASRLPWAWNGLCFAVPFNDATRDSARDLVFNAAPSTVGGTLTWSRDNRGNTAAYLDTVSYIDYPNNPAHNRPSTEITAYARFRRVGTGDASGGVFGKTYGLSGDGFPGATWIIQHADPANNTLSASLAADGIMNYWEAPGYTLGTTEWVSAVMRWRTNEAPTLYVLGERGQTLTSAALGWTPTGPLEYNNDPIRVNGNDYNTMNFNCEYSQLMLWSRKLTDAEVQALVADPYGWYSPRRETLGVSSPYPLVAGAGELRFGTGSGGLR